MENKIQKMDHHNPGIKCVVKSCYYYTEGDHCTAQKIEVQSINANSVHETDCATYRPRNQSFK
ncbi:DUF1540 domain-containing protein [Sedimentibacter sp. MB31-C6]|uniref:DUF1540 domain-containing protein n=1 Tax=Sedimentibacter sp. MB31-C6 TaxID=3109366 RepID=UPI002DDD18BD|nr:DUF1540 domain-containing protein [Sedimentibacter sp. MB36-C1]WSI04021.1 DUF1540 domain-containing protein [Sedimentibacter sp. MB36-C1]